MATVDVVEARLVANVAAFETGMRQADAAVVGLGQSLNTAQQRMAVGQVALSRTGTVAGETGRHVRRLENTLTGLALSGIGLTGPLGSVASILLNIGTSAKALIGVGAIFSGIALGIKRAQEQAKAFEETLTRIRARGATATEIVSGGDDPARLEAQARNIAANRDRAIVQASEYAARIREAEDAVRKLREGEDFAGRSFEIARLETSIIEWTKQMVAADAATATWDNALAAAMARLRELRAEAAAAQLQVRGLGDEFIDVSPRVAAFRTAQPRRTAPQDLATLVGGAKLEDISATFGTQSQQAILKAMTPSDEANLRLAQAGASAASALFRGFIDGSMKFEDILKNFLLAFVEIAIIGPLFQGLKIFSPSHISQEAGMQVGAGLVQGLQQSITGVQRASAMLATAAAPTIAPLGPFRLDATFSAANLPAPLTPFEAARDALWQTMYRETALVARSQGFR